MNSAVKIILIVAGIALAGYGIFELVNPEIDIDLGPIDIQAQDDDANIAAFVKIGIGAVLLLIGAFFGKK